MRCRAFVILVALTLVGCSGLSELGDKMVLPEPSVDDDDTYLEQTGPQSKIDIGGGGEQLLTRFQRVLDEKVRLEAREQELLDEVVALQERVRVGQAAHDDQERRRVGIEAEAERLRRIKNGQETEILHLQLQIADLQRTKLQLELAEVEGQLELVRAEKEPQAAPPKGGH